MKDDKKVGDIMSHIEEYETIREDEPLCNAIHKLRDNFEKIQAAADDTYHKTFMVTDKEGEIINQPQKFMNHTMDAIRYGVFSFIEFIFQWLARYPSIIDYTLLRRRRQACEG